MMCIVVRHDVGVVIRPRLDRTFDRARMPSAALAESEDNHSLPHEGEELSKAE